MSSRPSPILDISLAIFLIAISLAVLWESRHIRPGVFEPLGSAPVPQATAVILILLCLVVLIRAVIRLFRLHQGVRQEAPDEETPSVPENPRAVMLTGALTIIYILLLTKEVASFAIITTAFLFVLISSIAQFNRRNLVVAAIIAVIMGYGCQYVFTQIFVVDLPAG